MDMVRSRFASISRHLSSATKPRRVPSKYKSLAIGQAQQAITDYLHSTRSLSYTFAEHIAKNAAISIQNLISKLDFSVTTFSKSIRKHLSYHPINEFEFFFESIGIEYSEVNEFLPPNKFFFSEDRSVLDAACTLSGFGFPWNRLGKLYEEESSIFRQSPDEITSRLLNLKDHGFSTFAVIGICLAIPRALLGGEESRCLSVNLKRLFEEFDTEDFVEENVDSWFALCSKFKVFYHLGGNDKEMWELIGRHKPLFMEHPEEVLIQKTEFFCRFGVRKVDVALLILKCPEIMSFDLETPVVSVAGILKHFGLSEDELLVVSRDYPYVFGRNKMANLPHVMRALDLHDWIFDRLRNGNHHFLASYSLNNPDEDIIGEYRERLEEIQRSRTPTHTMHKLDFLHGIGFGENALTLKVLQHAHGSSTELTDRFRSLLDGGIRFSKLCMLIRLAPKILNQKPGSIEDKLRFLRGEMGASMDYLDVFPAFLCFDLEYRIKPRFRFHEWLLEKKLCSRSYSIASMVATSEKAFIARLYGLHPAIPKQWLERFSYRKQERNVC
ncbi:PREDICTED: transcription termination factor MTEF18, mitochondrial [Tarenaya hassleriana]|uniref:transcription termination factor MTEF18, mitochondrial n=1 Tax=Tarenaya hassleriana TaxID=28532 RepID=UPI00053C8AF4|nr:PREDICTED: transcription termination factor MTEF18, mitochondrial [Tarenaya hassleriana]